VDQLVLLDLVQARKRRVHHLYLEKRPASAGDIVDVNAGGVRKPGSEFLSDGLFGDDGVGRWGLRGTRSSGRRGRAKRSGDEAGGRGGGGRGMGTEGEERRKVPD